MKINTVGFIGTGVMGKSMIRHLLKKYNVVVYNRTKERALDLRWLSKRRGRSLLW